MKRILIVLVLLQLSLNLFAVEKDSTYRYTILLTGASFASPQNTWFEMGCRKLDARPLNRAVGGEAIANTANRMKDGTLYSVKELEDLDAFVIMQVHNKDVFDESHLLTKYTDYPTPFNRDNYAMAFDYVIKRYLSECYELRNNPQSRYYGTPAGKLALIVLCTDWHDGRKIYNSSVRKLVDKWGLPLIEFDKNIGFSDKMLHPVTGQQTSLLYAKDTQMIDGVKYGWHPVRGEQSYIQQRMAAIFADMMDKLLPLK